MDTKPLNTMRRRIYDMVVNSPRGLTAFEVIRLFQMPDYSFRARLAELKTMGYLKHSGETRPNSRGVAEQVYVAA